MTVCAEGQGKVDAAGKFNVEAAIAEFLADPAAKSLELPHMAADQRKHARSLVDQHPELKCESYGFGAERQLHLFKRAAKATAATDAAGVRVKNTFIDDWITAEGGDAEAEPPIFRSMPLGLQGGILPDCSQAVATPSATRRVGDSSSSCSTAASVAASSPSVSVASTAAPGSPTPSSREPSALPEGVDSSQPLMVRNTFIHIDSSSADDRVVQSMPHGMFRQCLWDEARAKESAAAAPGPAAPAVSTISPAPTEAPACLATEETLPPPPQAPAVVHAAALSPAELGSQVLPCGTEVMIEGLTKFPAFNGLVGVVQSLDEDTGRYNILLSVPAGPGGHQWAKVKAENLKTTLPPPPTSFAAGPMFEDFYFAKGR